MDKILEEIFNDNKEGYQYLEYEYIDENDLSNYRFILDKSKVLIACRYYDGTDGEYYLGINNVEIGDLSLTDFIKKTDSAIYYMAYEKEM